MKIQPSRRASGFTLVELLVVIVIIAVLATASLSVAIIGKRKAEQTKALNVIVAIEQGVTNFVNDYGTYPKNNVEGDEKIATAESSPAYNREFANILQGNEIVQTPLNTKSIKYIGSIPEGKAKRGGIVYEGEDTAGSGANVQVRAIYDPWGGPYLVQFDGDYDESITVKTASEKTSKVVRGKKVAVWSNGESNTTDQNGKGKNTDSVKSWK